MRPDPFGPHIQRDIADFLRKLIKPAIEGPGQLSRRSPLSGSARLKPKSGRADPRASSNLSEGRHLPNFTGMTFRSATLLLLGTLGASSSFRTEAHPVERLGEDVFASFKARDFRAFRSLSLFSLSEDQFRTLLGPTIHTTILQLDEAADTVILETEDGRTPHVPLDELTQEQRDLIREWQSNPEKNELSFVGRIKNDALNEALRAGNTEPWEHAFRKNWRKHWRHLLEQPAERVRDQAFRPILAAAENEGLQWETARLTEVAVLLNVTFARGRFEARTDSFGSGPTSSRALWLERGLKYRLRLDKRAYGHAFMIGSSPDDSESQFDAGILRNGTGSGDIVALLDSAAPTRLHYFCPDRKGAGGPVIVTNADDQDKPNPRLNLLLTFTYGTPAKAYQILVKEVLRTPRGPLFFERPEWLGKVD